MELKDLPVGSNPLPLNFSHFPTLHQAVVWRNWGMISVAKLATILKTDEKTILSVAAEMGLPVPPKVNVRWLKRGYVTLIKANWHLLPYEQLLHLLDWSAEKMAFTLREEDFLWTKLGNLKPTAQPVYYSPLTADEKKKTLHIKQLADGLYSQIKKREDSFAFLDNFKDPDYLPYRKGKSSIRSEFNPRIIYAYSAVFGDPLLDASVRPFTDDMIKRYSDARVSAVWMQSILYTLFPVKKAMQFSTGYEKRLDALKGIVDKLQNYGMNLYLYLNEPRGMPEDFYEYCPEMKGIHYPSTNMYSMCTSKKATLEYLQDACSYVFGKVPQLGGAFSISMSENLTHCHSRLTGDMCPECSKRSIPDVISEVNTALEQGIHAGSPDSRLIVWDWAWKEEWEAETIKKLPRNIDFMCVSEWGKKLNIGSVENTIIDYSISNPGPSEKSRNAWKVAKERGLNTIAKVQLNNSWECSAIPYLPVPYLVKEHMDNLKEAGVNGLFMSWTLGGYPGGNIELLDSTPEELAEKYYGASAAPGICDAWKIFCDAFREFPFHVAVLYFSPHNMGPGNLFFSKKTNYNASMVGFPYDDIDSWRANYPRDVFENQFRKLSEKWKAGLAILADAEKHIGAENENYYEDLKTVAVSAYCHFRSAYLQARFVNLRDSETEGRVNEMLKVLDEELEIASKMFVIACADSRIGFEATNHYCYTPADLLEKVLNCEKVKEEIKHDYHQGTGTA
jgi:hypothetical protein